MRSIHAEIHLEKRLIGRLDLGVFFRDVVLDLTAFLLRLLSLLVHALPSPPFLRRRPGLAPPVILHYDLRSVGMQIILFRSGILYPPLIFDRRLRQLPAWAPAASI